MSTVSESAPRRFTIPNLREDLDRLKKQGSDAKLTLEEFVKLNPELLWMNPLRREKVEETARKVVSALVRNEGKVGGSEEIYDMALSIMKEGVHDEILLAKCGDKYTVIDGSVRTIILREFYKNGFRDILVLVRILPWCFESDPLERAKAILMAFSKNAIGTRTPLITISNENIVTVVTDGLLAYTYNSLPDEEKAELIDALSNVDITKLLSILRPLAREVGLPENVVETFVSIMKADKNVRAAVVKALQRGEYMSPKLAPVIKDVHNELVGRKIDSELVKPAPPIASEPQVQAPQPTQAPQPPQPKPAQQRPTTSVPPLPPPPPPLPPPLPRLSAAQPQIAGAREESTIEEPTLGKRVPQKVAEALEMIKSDEVREAAFKAAAEHQWTREDAELLIALPGFIKSRRIDGDPTEIMMRAIEAISKYRDLLRGSSDLVCACGDSEIYMGNANYKHLLNEVRLYALARGVPLETIDEALMGFINLLYTLLERGRTDIVSRLPSMLGRRRDEDLLQLARELINALTQGQGKK